MKGNTSAVASSMVALAMLVMALATPANVRGQEQPLMKSTLLAMDQPQPPPPTAAPLPSTERNIQSEKEALQQKLKELEQHEENLRKMQQTTPPLSPPPAVVAHTVVVIVSHQQMPDEQQQQQQQEGNAQRIIEDDTPGNMHSNGIGTTAPSRLPVVGVEPHGSRSMHQVISGHEGISRGGGSGKGYQGSSPASPPSQEEDLLGSEIKKGASADAAPSQQQQQQQQGLGTAAGSSSSTANKAADSAIYCAEKYMSFATPNSLSILLEFCNGGDGNPDSNGGGTGNDAVYRQRLLSKKKIWKNTKPLHVNALSMAACGNVDATLLKAFPPASCAGFTAECLQHMKARAMLGMTPQCLQRIPPESFQGVLDISFLSRKSTLTMSDAQARNLNSLACHRALPMFTEDPAKHFTPQRRRVLINAAAWSPLEEKCFSELKKGDAFRSDPAAAAAAAALVSPEQQRLVGKTENSLASKKNPTASVKGFTDANGGLENGRGGGSSGGGAGASWKITYNKNQGTSAGGAAAGVGSSVLQPPQPQGVPGLSHPPPEQQQQATTTTIEGEFEVRTGLSGFSWLLVFVLVSFGFVTWRRMSLEQK